HDGHEHTEVNEHVWFSFDTVRAMARAVEAQLAALDPAGADDFRANLETFENELTALRDRATALAAVAKDRTVVVTEPVAEYLIGELRLHDLTPPSFPSAI